MSQRWALLKLGNLVTQRVKTRDEILSILKQLNYSYEYYEHPPIYTALEAQLHCKHIPGVHVKNLFLCDSKKTNFWLITLPDLKRVDLNAFASFLGVGRLSFASKECLVTMLGVQPGSVTPLAIINDKHFNVKLLLDKELLNSEYISMHPMENTATVRLKLNDLLRFIEIDSNKKIDFIEIPNLTDAL